MSGHAEYRRGAFLVGTDPARLDRRAIHGFLTRSYGAEGIPLERASRSIEGSLCFGLFEALRAPERYMEKVVDPPYRRAAAP